MFCFFLTFFLGIQKFQKQKIKIWQISEFFYKKRKNNDFSGWRNQKTKNMKMRTKAKTMLKNGKHSKNVEENEKLIFFIQRFKSLVWEGGEKPKHLDQQDSISFGSRFFRLLFVSKRPLIFPPPRRTKIEVLSKRVFAFRFFFGPLFRRSSQTQMQKKTRTTYGNRKWKEKLKESTAIAQWIRHRTMHEIDSEYILHVNVILEWSARPFQVVDETHQEDWKKRFPLTKKMIFRILQMSKTLCYFCNFTSQKMCFLLHRTGFVGPALEKKCCGSRWRRPGEGQIFASFFLFSPNPPFVLFLPISDVLRGIAVVSARCHH